MGRGPLGVARVTCPTCKGTKTRTVYACPGFRAAEVACFTCDGTGELTAERRAWRERGALEREARIQRGEIQREAASRWGVDVARYSRMEHGLEPFPDHTAPADGARTTAALP